MTDDDASAFAQLDAKAIPQFAPNYSVYLLPADAICLYSEDRKFVLHGRLFCVIAAAIAEGGRNFGALVAELEKYFPAFQIHQAFERLIERRYVVAASPSSDSPVAGYWASLGLPPAMAEQNLRACRVHIQAIDVDGAAQIDAALRDMGVRVVKRGGDLAIALVGDYLDARLDVVNRRHLGSGVPWVLVQPSGVFPLIGPMLSPGNGPCWRCLADRMQRNREVRAMLDRGDARRLITSPLAGQSVGGSGIQLAAIEIAKAIATGFRTDLGHSVVSIDLSGANVVKHHVARRPQCAACGDADLRDPQRAPLPITLAPGGKPVMTSGGYRTVSSRATVQRNRKHVSLLTGVVSRLDRIEAELPLSTSFYARHNFAGPAKSVNELRGGLSGGSYGKGSTAEQGEASALMEAIERYSGIFQGDEIRAPRRFADFAPGDAIAPNDVLLYSEAQHRRSIGSDAHSEDQPINLSLFGNAVEMDWSPLWSLRDERFRHLPTSMLYFFYSGAVPFAADSNGCAAGNTREEAVVQGFLELVERDAYAIWWYNRLRCPAVDLALFDDSYVRELHARLVDNGRQLWVLDVTSDLGIPTFVAINYWVKDGRENVEFGSGAHFDARIAMLRTLTELNQFLSIGFMDGGDGDKSSLDGSSPFRLAEHPYLSPLDGRAARRKSHAKSDEKFGRRDTDEQVRACVGLVARLGLDFLVLDQTRPDIEVPVVRVVVPGLRHFYRRFAPGRLYEVPVKLGVLDRPTAEDGLNPIHPHS